MTRGERQELDLRGDLQTEIMTSVWKLGRARVEDVRALQPSSRRSAYNTIQTVMNRLVDRGLLVRERAREGKAYVYRPRYEESEYVARAINEHLTGVSPDTRKAALLTLVEELDSDELDEIARLARTVKRRRGRP